MVRATVEDVESQACHRMGVLRRNPIRLGLGLGTDLLRAKGQRVRAILGVGSQSVQDLERRLDRRRCRLECRQGEVVALHKRTGLLARARFAMDKNLCFRARLKSGRVITACETFTNQGYRICGEYSRKHHGRNRCGTGRNSHLLVWHGNGMLGELGPRRDDP